VQAILITGPVASGKTVVAQEIVAIAEERGMAVAAVDLDWLGWVTGANESHDEVIGRNLAAIAANYADVGVSHLVAARALVGAAALLTIERALPGWELVVVELEATHATLESRLRNRDVGRELEHNLGHLAIPFEALPIARRIANENRELREVALQVLAIAGWS
jgi:hypothetical protein